MLHILPEFSDICSIKFRQVSHFQAIIISFAAVNWLMYHCWRRTFIYVMSTCREIICEMCLHWIHCRIFLPLVSTITSSRVSTYRPTCRICRQPVLPATGFRVLLTFHILFSSHWTLIVRIASMTSTFILITLTSAGFLRYCGRGMVWVFSPSD